MDSLLKEFAEKLRELKWEIAERVLVCGDVFILCVLAHGGKDHVVAVDGEPIHIDHDIIRPFDGNNFPELQGKPKVFLVQACRGKREYLCLQGSSL